MPRGSKPGERRGGRQKGAKNKATLAHIKRAAEAAKAGVTPLEMLLGAARYHWALAWVNPEQPDRSELERATALAKDAAPYVHPRLNSIEGNPEKPLIPDKFDVLDAGRRLAFTIEAAKRELLKGKKMG